MSREYKFIAEWDENTSVEWWNQGRRMLNEGISAYNDWQKRGCPADKRREVLAIIEYSRQTIEDRFGDAGSNWIDVCTEMKEFVERKPDCCPTCGHQT